MAGELLAGDYVQTPKGRGNVRSVHPSLGVAIVWVDGLGKLEVGLDRITKVETA